MGIATKANGNNNTTEVFLYLSEAAKGDQPVRNRVYKYQWNGETLINPKLILDLPAEGLNHPGGKLAIGPDHYLYAVIGDHRTELRFDNDNVGSSSSSGLLDKVADNKAEVAAVTLATGFRGITDIKTGPDGLLYILTFDEKSRGEGKIYRISSASGGNL